MLSLWDGWAPNVQRSFIVNAAELATYDYFKQLLLRLKFFQEGPELLVHTLDMICPSKIVTMEAIMEAPALWCACEAAPP